MSKKRLIGRSDLPIDPRWLLDDLDEITQPASQTDRVNSNRSSYFPYSLTPSESEKDLHIYPQPFILRVVPRNGANSSPNYKLQTRPGSLQPLSSELPRRRQIQQSHILFRFCWTENTP